ncbi:MAG: hypothetical protein ACJAVM_001422 [Sulfitobacter sp.]|jgi:hypothetical protein
MIKHAFILLVTGVTLSACQPAVPDSGQGAGFGDTYEAQRRARDSALASSVPAAIPVAQMPLSPAGSASGDASAAATAAETARVLAATRPGGAAPSPYVNASPSNPAPAVVNATGISNENNFDAVSGQRSIDDDAARIAANKAQYEVVTPQALPDRVDSGPNIVAYALQTQNAVGEQIYRRIGLNKAAKYTRACASVNSPEQAQIEFLSLGGPEKDRKGMDPDGDGFACDWDPMPFRRAARG